MVVVLLSIILHVLRGTGTVDPPCPCSPLCCNRGCCYKVFPYYSVACTLLANERLTVVLLLSIQIELEDFLGRVIQSFLQLRPQFGFRGPRTSL